MELDASAIIWTIINIGLLCCIPFVIYKYVKFSNKQKIMEKEICELKEEIKNR